MHDPSGGAQPKKGRMINIPIVELESNRIAGGFCASVDVVSSRELQALAHIKTLRLEAEQIKGRLRGAVDADKKAQLSERLKVLRAEAAVWRAKREQATHDKHVALGHIVLPTA